MKAKILLTVMLISAIGFSINELRDDNAKDPDKNQISNISVDFSDIVKTELDYEEGIPTYNTNLSERIELSHKFEDDIYTENVKKQNKEIYYQSLNKTYFIDINNKAEIETSIFRNHYIESLYDKSKKATIYHKIVLNSPISADEFITLSTNLLPYEGESDFKFELPYFNTSGDYLSLIIENCTRSDDISFSCRSDVAYISYYIKDKNDVNLMVHADGTGNITNHHYILRKNQLLMFNFMDDEFNPPPSRSPNSEFKR